GPHSRKMVSANPLSKQRPVSNRPAACVQQASGLCPCPTGDQLLTTQGSSSTYKPDSSTNKMVRPSSTHFYPLFFRAQGRAPLFFPLSDCSLTASSSCL